MDSVCCCQIVVCALMCVLYRYSGDNLGCLMVALMGCVLPGMEDTSVFKGARSFSVRGCGWQIGANDHLNVFVVVIGGRGGGQLGGIVHVFMVSAWLVWETQQFSREIIRLDVERFL